MTKSTILFFEMLSLFFEKLASYYWKILFSSRLFINIFHLREKCVKPVKLLVKFIVITLRHPIVKLHNKKVTFDSYMFAKCNISILSCFCDYFLLFVGYLGCCLLDRLLTVKLRLISCCGIYIISLDDYYWNMSLISSLNDLIFTSSGS